MTSPPLNLFLMRELHGNTLFNQRNAQRQVLPQSWMTELASASVRVGEFSDLLNIASALPLPSSRKDRQHAIELTTFLLLLAPIVYATYAAARHDAPSPELALRTHLAATLPVLRRLGSVRLAHMPADRGEVGAFSEASELLSMAPVKEPGADLMGRQLPTSQAHVEVEVLLWRAAFQRLNDRGIRPSFPNNMGAARATWAAIGELLRAGARPEWSHAQAQTLLGLTAGDRRLPDDVQAFIQAEALREDRAFAPGKPRRI